MYEEHEEDAVFFPHLRSLQLELGILLLSVADDYAVLFCYMTAAQIER
jgi:hypothetical protein